MCARCFCEGGGGIGRVKSNSTVDQRAYQWHIQKSKKRWGGGGGGVIAGDTGRGADRRKD